jgi:hypothetical protein
MRSQCRRAIRSRADSWCAGTAACTSRMARRRARHAAGAGARRTATCSALRSAATPHPSCRSCSFTRVTFDARGYRRLLSERGVLAVRGLVSTDLTGDNGATPFYLQQSLGGGETCAASIRIASPIRHSRMRVSSTAGERIDMSRSRRSSTPAPSRRRCPACRWARSR